MATVTGARGTLNVGQAQRKVDMREEILLLEPDAAPLTVFSARARKRPAVNPQYSWIEDTLAPRFDAVNNGAGYASTATSVVVDNGAYFAEHDLVRVTRTGEVVRVTAVATNTLTVVRGVGSTAAALVDNDELLIIGSAQPEGDTSKPARSDNPTQVTNYTQIVRNPVEMTETMRSSDQFTTPHDWDYQRNKKGIEHKKDIEYAFLLGHPSENTSGSQPRRTTGGAYHFVTTNVTDAGGALTEAELFGALRPAFRYGSKDKVALASALAVDVLNGFPRSNIQVIQGNEGSNNTYGVRVMRYVSPHGTINLVTHWLLEGSYLGGHILILDMGAIAYRYLAGGVGGSRDTHIEENIQANDADTRKDEYKSEVGLEFGEEKRHALITGITS